MEHEKQKYLKYRKRLFSSLVKNEILLHSITNTENQMIFNTCLLKHKKRKYLQHRNTKRLFSSQVKEEISLHSILLVQIRLLNRKNWQYLKPLKKKSLYFLH